MMRRWIYLPAADAKGNGHMRKPCWPLAAYLGLMVPVAWLDIDRIVSGIWYGLQGQTWALKRHWLISGWLHDAAHDLVVAIYLLIVVLYLCSVFGMRLKAWRHGLSYLAVSLPAATLTVSLFKRLTRVDCPWSVVDFGGERSYQFWLQSIWSPLAGADHCFPSGHASSAYMFFGLYFFSLTFLPGRSRLILLLVISSGLLFGVAQQLRGAHFISHDLTSALLCWYVCLLLWLYWTRRYFRQAPA